MSKSFVFAQLASMFAAVSLFGSIVEVMPLCKTPCDSPLLIDFHTDNQVLSRNHPLFFQLKSYPLGVNVYSESLKGMRQNAHGSSILVIFNGNQRLVLKKIDRNPLKVEADSLEERYQKYLTSKIAKELKEGKNAVTAIALNSFGESIKEASAIQTKIVDYGKRVPRDPTFEQKLDAPYLLYNEPSGTFLKGEAVLLDFVLQNTTLSTGGNRVVVKIDGEEVALIDTYAPHKILHLPRGKHKVSLTLVDSKGHPYPHPFCPQEATIIVQ